MKKIITCLKFECGKYSIDDQTPECIESFISNNWNLILKLSDVDTVTNLLNGGAFLNYWIQ